MNYSIGVDVGGTHTKAGLFLGEKMIEFEDVKTETGKKVMTEIVRVIEKLGAGRDIGGIGVGLPGLVDSSRGFLYLAPNIPGLKNVDFKRILERRFSVRVEVDNDLNCSVIAEARARRLDDLVYINLGTGVGVGIILGGKLLRGVGRNLEAGHIIVGDGRKCNVGHAGCLEAFASGTGILRGASKIYRGKEVKELIGKKGSEKVFEEVAEYLARGIATLVNIFGFSVVVIGGGVSEIYPMISKGVERRVKKMVFKMPLIEMARMKNAGVFGARMLVD